MKISRTWLFLLTLATSATGMAQDPATLRVTAQTRVVSLQQALEAVNQGQPIKLVAGPTVLAEPVMIRVRDVPMDQLMARIATMIGGEWKANGTTYTLHRSDILTAAQTRKDNAALAKGYRRSIQTILDAMQKAGSYDQKALQQVFTKRESEDEEMESGPGYELPMEPGQRLMIRLVNQMPLDRIAGIARDRTLTFAVNPTRMQIALPTQTMALIDQYRREQEVFRKFMEEQAKNRPVREVPPTEVVDPTIETLPYQMHSDEVRSPVTTLGPTGRVLLRVSLAGFGGESLNFTLRIFDKEGKLVRTIPYFLSPEDEEEVEGAEAEESRREESPDEMSGPNVATFADLNLSTESKQFVGLLGQFMSESPSTEPLPKELLAAMQSPTIFDPINIVAGDVLSSVADHQKWNLVASLPDNYFEVLNSIFSASKVTLDQAKTMITQSRVTEVVEKDGWVTITPRLPSKAWAARMDRGALGYLMRADDVTGTVSLDDFAAYAARNPNPSGSIIFQIYAFLGAPSVSRFVSTSNYEIIQIYGLMSPQQRQLMAQNKQIAFQALSTVQRRLLEEFVYFSGRNLKLGDPKPKADSDPSPFPMPSNFDMEDYMADNQGTLAQEPTESMPNGLPMDGYIQIESQQKTIFKPGGNNPMLNMMMGGGGMELDQLASMIGMQESSSAQEYARYFPKIDSVMMGSMSEQTWTLWMAPKARMTAVLQDLAYPKDAKLYKISELPGDLGKKLRERIDQVKKTMEEVDREIGNRNAPPRPPQ